MLTPGNPWGHRHEAFDARNQSAPGAGRATGVGRAGLRLQPKHAAITPDAIEAELERRAAARADKNFALSDEIRDALVAQGVDVMDGDPLRWDWRLTLAQGS